MQGTFSLVEQRRQRVPVWMVLRFGCCGHAGICYYSVAFIFWEGLFRFRRLGWAEYSLLYSRIEV